MSDKEFFEQQIADFEFNREMALDVLRIELNNPSPNDKKIDTLVDRLYSYITTIKYSKERIVEALAADTGEEVSDYRV